MFSQKQIDDIILVAKKAGDIILKYYQGYKDLSVTVKEDNSQVTAADLAANSLIIKELQRLFPKIAIVSEENSQASNLKAAAKDQYFMIDPLDGTSCFIKKSDQFTVNIALISNYKPIFGVIYLPVQDIMYYTNSSNRACIVEQFSDGINKFANVKKMKVSSNKDNLVVICTKREPERSRIIDELKSKNVSIKEIISVSSSYKFCLIAQGKADLYPRRISIRAWDVAAGHAIVKAAGGSMVDLTAKEITYNFINDFKIPFFEVY